MPLHFEWLTIDGGLSQGYISDITQDKKGLMWFATGDGLNKYDGYTFTVYHHNPYDSTSLASDDLTALFEDSKERLWVATRHNGMDLFDRENNTFIHFRHKGKNSLRSDNIISITEDKTGALWVRTEEGIDRFEIKEDLLYGNKDANDIFGKTYLFTHIRLDQASEGIKENVSTPYVFIDSRNRVLVTTNFKILEIKYDPALDIYRLEELLTFPSVDFIHTPAMIEDTVRHVLYVNNEELLKFPGIDFSKPEPVLNAGVGLLTWTIDQDKRLWVADRTRMAQVNLATGKVSTVVAADPAMNAALSISTVHYTDRSGVVWIGTGGYGILKYDPETEHFHHIMPGTNIYQLIETRPGTLMTNGMDAITIKRDSPVTARRPIPINIMQKKFPDYDVVSFSKDTTGNLWLGIHAGLMRYNFKEKNVLSYKIPATDRSTLPFPIYADKKDNVWMGYNRYFMRYNITTGEFKKMGYPGTATTFDYDFLQCIYEDGELLWLGSTNGLYRFDIKRNRMRWYNNRIGDTTTISNNFIFSIVNDGQRPERYLWIGTKGGGLNRLDKKTGKVIRYNTRSGMPNNVVYGILPDNDGNLWISTNKGLSKFNTSSQVFTNYLASDGLQSNEFNRYACTKTSEGLFVFGGMNGLNFFDPADIKPLDPPDVVLTDFRLFNKPVGNGRTNTPLKKDIRFSQQVILRYEQNVITFQFAVMDYRTAGNARYRYRMEGFDKEWIYSGAVREATYTNLDPGDYRFVVQGSFANGRWGLHDTSIKVFVIAPWWRTWWFYSLVTTVFISATYAFYRYRLFQLTKMEGLRNRIARDLHDEVGSSISTIAIYSRIVQEHLGSATFNNETLMKKITDNACEIMEAMNDIVWNINSKNDAFEFIIGRMREHAHQLFEAKGYLLHFDFDEDLQRLKLKMDKRKDFYLIYKEALNNVAKYAQGKNVWISLTTTNSRINLVIRDDGRGFDPKAVRKNSNGLSNMNFRAKALKGRIRVTSAPGAGTEIHLNF